MSKQLDGVNFENDIHNLLQGTQLDIKREKDVKNIFGSNNTCIDHFFENINILYCIQTKHVTSHSATISQIHHFIKCIENIQKKTNKHCIAIYLSLLPISKPSQKAFEEENINNKKIQYINIFHKDTFILQQKLKYFLHYHKIFFYDNEYCVEMLDLSNKFITNEMLL